MLVTMVKKKSELQEMYRTDLTKLNSVQLIFNYEKMVSLYMIRS